jgi:RNA polymerase sigma factor (sigma-70 family)
VHTCKENLKPLAAPTSCAVSTDHVRQAEVSDLSLIRRIAQQDHEAFDLLYKQYAPRLASFLLPLLQDASLVDEAINEAMFVVWQKAAQFRPSGRLSTWVFVIARYKALKLLKTSTRQSPDCPDPEMREHLQAGPEALCIEQQQTQMITQAVCTLPPHLREVVEGIYYSTLTYPELANRLGCSVSTVKNRMENARRRLATHMRQRRRNSFGRCPSDTRADQPEIRESLADRSKGKLSPAA